MKNAKGITLVALVVTIIILIILAGVSINLVLGENGIITRAKEAKAKTEQAQLNEQAALNEMEKYIENSGIYTVTFKGTNVTSNGESIINLQQTNYSATLTPASGCIITSITIKMGGTTLVENTDYTYTNGIIEIPNVTGNIEIIVETDYQTVESKKTASLTYFTEKTTLKDSNGNLIKVPEGFKIAEDSGKNVTEGIVIEDNDIKTGIGNNRGNQYVWIPVGNGIKKSDGTSVNITLGRYTFADGTNDKASDGTTVLAKGTPILKQSAENYTSVVTIGSYHQELPTSRIGSSSSNTNTTALNLKGFIDSVKENGGYYIARYEASYGTDGKVNSKVSNSAGTSAPTTEGALWNCITQINAATASRGLYTTATTDLINSYAWDTAIVYIQEFSGDTDYTYQTSKNKSGPANTGVNGDEVCKINDMASNIYEWTTEYSTRTGSSYYDGPCTSRGGSYDNTNVYTSYRHSRSATGNTVYRAFRSALYM